MPDTVIINWAFVREMQERKLGRKLTEEEAKVFSDGVAPLKPPAKVEVTKTFFDHLLED